jgi:2-polyprenyl-3-methyl-5-hydroxy-6-metoxy-1,4-benzoquinol methylase
MESELKQLKITRHNKTGVGKKIGNHIWFHKNYISDFMPTKEYDKYLSALPEDFNFKILRLDTKTSEIAFIESNDFDSNNEPLVGRSIRIFNDINGIHSSKINEPTKDPLIYHHKWLFVKDNYDNFDIKQSKERSIEWKTKLGVDKMVTSRIGRLSFWNNWLDENSLPTREINQQIMEYLTSKTIKNKNIPKEWELYVHENFEQSVSSAKTARVQIPRSFNFIEAKLNHNNPILLDIGCGVGNKIFSEKLESIGVNYNGCDPFNQSNEYNLKSINTCMNGQADIVTLNSVLNTIPEPQVWNSILLQAHNALKENTGILSVIIYEGDKTAQERKEELAKGVKTELTPIKTRDGWQNRMKTAEYLPEIRKIFPNSEVVTLQNGKAIVASKNLELDLTIYNKTKQNKRNKP